MEVFAILGIIIFLCGLFSGHDWSLFFLRRVNLENPEQYSRYAKFSVTFLSALLIWTAAAFATYLTWIFYAPALVLTALSCYELDRRF